MTTAHDGEGYMLRNRRRLKDSSLIKAETKKIFDIPEVRNLTSDIRKYHLSKLALLVIRAIDDYN